MTSCPSGSINLREWLPELRGTPAYGSRLVRGRDEGHRGTSRPRAWAARSGNVPRAGASVFVELGCVALPSGRVRQPTSPRQPALLRLWGGLATWAPSIIDSIFSPLPAEGRMSCSVNARPQADGQVLCQGPCALCPPGDGVRPQRPSLPAPRLLFPSPPGVRTVPGPLPSVTSPAQGRFPGVAS